MKREQVLEICYSAQTLAEIANAREARSSYLRVHPGDQEVFELGSMLAMTEDAVKIAEQMPIRLLQHSAS